VLLDAGCFAPWSGATPQATPATAAGSAQVEFVAVEAPQSRTTVTGIQAPKADEQTIRPDGAVHVEEAQLLILGALRGAQASLGGSKSLVDSSGEGEAVLPFMTHLNQVGQTGSTPRHQKGLSTCCHGEEPHVVGWRFVTERRAVNLDPNCGWSRGKADVVYVADAFAVVRELNRLLG
jgi:electron transfer flavoprotein alpha subunit